jgi:hemerythrin
METKHGDLTKLPKKVKFLLKKYLSFAEQHLSEKEVKAVLDRAATYAREHFQQESSDESDSQ